MNYCVKTQKLIESFGFKIVSKDFDRKKIANQLLNTILK